ncbi:MAG: translation initiation factor IF-2 associated domain-containing protein, partial [Quisquiliibacterium sp.]
MESMNVARFAEELKVPADVLLEQLRDAGVNKSSAEDSLTEADKEQLLAALRRAHGAEEAPKRKITLTRKQTSEIKQADGSGRARTIQVEVRKKRVFVKRGAGEASAETGRGAAEAGAANAETAVQSAAREAAELEQQRIRDEEDRRQRELLERQAADLRDKQQRLEMERQREAEATAEAARREQDAQEGLAKARAAEQAVAAGANDDPAVAAAAEAAAREAAQAAQAAKQAQAEAQTQAKARRAVESEVAEINRLMSSPRKTQAKAAGARAAKAASESGAQTAPSGTLHRPSIKQADRAGAAPAPEGKEKKHVKSEKLSSSWHEEGAKRRAIKTRGAPSGPGGWRGPRSANRNRSEHRDDSASAAAPSEPIVREVHVPETITVADLAHKMSVKAAEVIKK